MHPLPRINLHDSKILTVNNLIQKTNLMEKRIGTITILVSDRKASPQVNAAISQYADIVMARQGLPFHGRPAAVISLIVEGDVNQMNALSGKLGRLDGVEVKIVVTKYADKTDNKNQ